MSATTPSLVALMPRLRAWSANLGRNERRRLHRMLLVVGGLHLVGWTTLLGYTEHGGSSNIGLGIGLTAYSLGVRHAFDADHIAAIDNTTRKLMASQQRPISVGFWFSLGHSSVVLALVVLLTVGLRTLAAPLGSQNSGLHEGTKVIGSAISGSFLYLIAAANLVVLNRMRGTLRNLQAGRYDDAEFNRHLDNRGLLARAFRRGTNAIDTPWKMYPLGVLFGLGFDTATEIGLLVLATAGATSGMAWWAAMSLPVLFAAGMSLFDTLDGAFMNVAYGWALDHPIRKVYFNVTITALSVLAAFLVGTAELLSLLSDELGLHDPLWHRLSGVDLNAVGFVLVGVFVGTWALAVLIWKIYRLEERHSASGGPDDARTRNRGPAMSATTPAQPTA